MVKILHVCPVDKFIPSFIDFVEQHFDMEEHEFRVFGDVKSYPIKGRGNVYITGINRGKKQAIKDYLDLIITMHKAEKIILHGLFIERVTQMLWAMPWLLKKCYWVMWGGDLYVYSLSDRTLEWHKSEFFRRFVIKNMGYLVNGTKGDITLARKWYGARGKHIQCFNYPSNIYKPYAIQEKKHTTINIQVGNSADPSNQHFEIFEKLKRYKDENIKLYVPLSYGDKSYSEQVIEKGRELFGDKLEPLTEFIPFEQYLDFLAIIDIAVFNHRRQQAFGNIITLLGLGKKVFMNSESTLNGVFLEFDITIYDVEDLDIELLGDKTRLSNIQKVKDRFSEESLVKSLKKWIG